MQGESKTEQTDVQLRHAREKILHIERDYYQLIEQNADAMVVVDKDKVIRHVNPAAVILFGRPMETLRGSRFEWPLEINAIPEIRIPRENQEPLIAEMRVVNARWEDQPVFLASLRDITERRRVEVERRELVERTRQMQKTESLSLLAGGIAHDFNNMLQVIIGAAELALTEMPASAAVRANIENIMRTSRCMADMTRQMSVYSGGHPFAVQALNLNELLRDIRPQIDASLPGKLAIAYELAENLPDINGDEPLLKQAVVNLVQNAIEAIGDQAGTITICTGVRTPDAAAVAQMNPRFDLAMAPYVALDISDTGCGMDAATQALVFDPFFSTKFVGRGLGLAMVMGIVRAHRGAISITSAPGSGTTMHVLLPSQEVAVAITVPAKPALPRESKVAAAPATILVVDDEPGVRDIVSRILHRSGFQVLTAANGVEAVEVFRRDPAAVALILLDLTMPKMDGVQAFREIHRLRSDVPVIISSGYSEQDTMQRFGDDWPALFLPKPYDFQLLLKLVRNVLNLKG